MPLLILFLFAAPMASHAVRRQRAVPLWLLALGLWLGGSTGVLALGGEKSCGGSPGSQACGAQTDQEDPALLQLRTAQGTAQGGPPGATPPPVLTSNGCPGSPGIFCQGNQCCPGFDRTGNLTFPCPSADPGFDGCDLKPPQSKFGTPTGTFPAGTARAMAEFARASYCGPNSNLRNWTCEACNADVPGFGIVPNSMRFISLPDVLQTEAIFVFLARIEVMGPLFAEPAGSEVDCIMSFRGSNNDANWYRNLQFFQTPYDDSGTGSCPGCQVETGFYEVWKAARESVVNTLKELGCGPGGQYNDLYITGHSLGAAVGVIGMFELEDLGYDVQRSVLFESPLPGNDKFALAFEKRFNRDVTAWRITHAKDPVVHVPPWWMGYSTFGTEVYFEPGVTAKGGKVCTGLWSKSCSYQWPLSTTLQNVDDHCNTPLLDGASICSPPASVCGAGVKSAIPVLTVHAYGSAP